MLIFRYRRLRSGGIGGAVLALIGVLALVALIVGGCAVSGYNRAIGLEQQVKGAWAQVENQLQRRYDLIPNLVETVKGYASHEDKVFTDIAEARKAYFSAGSDSEKASAAGGVERALSRLLMLKETYPELKAQANFLDLQSQLEGTENRISVERKRYNDAVQALNAYVRGFPGRIFAGWAGVSNAEYFEAPREAQTPPQVKFGKE